MDLRRVLRRALVSAVYAKDDTVTLHFHPDAPIPAERLAAFVRKNAARLSPDLRLSCRSAAGETAPDAIRDILRRLGQSW